MDNIQSLKKPKKETKQTSAKDIIKDLLWYKKLQNIKFIKYFHNKFTKKTKISL
jgi:hypothetical protein